MHACGNWLHDVPLYLGLFAVWFGIQGRGAIAWLRRH